VAVALAAPSVHAAIAVTWESTAPVSEKDVVSAVRRTAATLDRRLHAR
jgi:hypothetical protein